MSRPRVYHTPEEARQIRNGYQRTYDRQHPELQKAPHWGAKVLSREEPSAEMIADAERRNTAPYSSRTAELCGDPKPGQSALDKQRNTIIYNEEMESVIAQPSTLEMDIEKQ